MKKSEIEDIYPLTPMQEGILFHSLSGVGSGKGMYCEQFSRQLTQIDPERYALAWQLAVDTHQVLRTAFFWEQLDKPVQVVKKQVTITIDLTDLSQLKSEEQTSETARLLQQEIDRGFDLEAPPLMRLALWRLSAESYQFAWTYHHILLDGWSAYAVLNHVIQIYSALSGGHPRDEIVRMLEKGTPTTFKQYVAWIKQQDLASAEQFWRKELRGITRPTPIPIERITKGQERNQDYDCHWMTMPRQQAEEMRQFCRQHRLTMGTLCEGAWALVLARYSGEKNVLYGLTISGRPADLTGVDAIVGLCINTIPLRVQVDSEAECVTWLRELQQHQFNLHHYQYSPLHKVQAWSDVERGVNLFNSLLAIESYPAALDIVDDGYRLGKIQAYQKTNYPLTVVVEPDQDINLRISYDQTRYEAGTVARLVGHFAECLRGLVRGAGRRVGDVEVLSSTERKQVVSEWNVTTRVYPVTGGLHERFEAQVRSQPEAPAVRYEENTVSYAELNARANRLARRLQAQGVGPEVLVGVYLERSIELVVSLLAILKAGGAYVPLDPSYPMERVQYMLQDAGVQVVVTTQAGAARLGGYSGCWLDVEMSWAEYPSTDLGVAVVPTQAAYVIYTSGSTGRPKGVIVTHGNVLRLMSATEEWYHFDASDVWTLFHSYAFDFSVWELWGALTFGGSLVVVPYWISRSPEAFYKLLIEESVTVLNQTPSAFYQLNWVDSERGVDPRLMLRVVIFGGEALNLQNLRSWFERHGDARPQLVNMYGITETTVHVTYRLIRWADVEGKHAQSVIGQPIPDLQAYVLDQDLRPLPIGVPGELYVGGAGVARGYLNQPRLTAERFIPDPFSGRPGARLYKTGDIAKWLPEGELDYLGRNDYQVKIRGFRIELGEIEAALVQHPAVREALVTIHAGQREDRFLLAHLVRVQNVEVTNEELREHLLQVLPEYMVPTKYVVLAQFPLTANGKVDRQALPMPDSEVGLRDEYVAPQPGCEQQLAEVWAQVLGIERVGREDNFFALGGDSILSIQVVWRAKQRGLRLTPRHLFEYPTIAVLAPQVQMQGELAPELSGEQQGVVPLSPIQRAFFAWELARPEHYNQAFVVEVSAPLEEAGLRAAITAVLKHHDLLRSCYRRGEHGWQQEILAAEMVRWDEVVIREQVEACSEGELKARIRAWQGRFELERGPLMRAIWFDQGGVQPDRVLLVAHHLVIDGVSWRIILEDVDQAYAQWRRGELIELGPKSRGYGEWVRALEQEVRHPDTVAELEYWTAPGRREQVRLPVDRAADEILEGRAGVVRVQVGRHETRILLQDAPQRYRVQLPEVLLAALAQVVGEWTGQQHALVDLEGHGREALRAEVDISRTVGWFTSLYPVLLKLPEGEWETGRVLKAIKEQLRRVPRRGLGYGLLRYLGEASTQMQLAELPPPEISFNYLGQLDRDVTDAGDGQLRILPELVEEVRGPSNRLPHAITIDCWVADGYLEMQWMYSSERYERETIEKLTERFLVCLQVLLQYCLTTQEGGYTPADFPLTLLTQEQVDRVVGSDRTVADIYPLSPTQQGMLFHTLYQPTSGVYFDQFTCQISDLLDIKTFQAVWAEVLASHPQLGSRFVWEGVQAPLQVVSTVVQPSWTIESWEGLSAAEEETKFTAVLDADRVRGFDLAKGCPLRFTVITVDSQRTRFLWSWHHIVLDGWSMLLVAREVFQTYAAFKAGQRPSRPARRPYRDYIAWLSRQTIASAETYWRTRLAGGSPTELRLPRPTHPPSGGHSAEYEHLLPVEMLQALQQFARGHGLTLTTVVQAAWALVLARYSDSEDVIFGVTLSGRPAELDGVEEMVGLFINTLPLRVTVAGEQDLISWLHDLQQEQAALQQHTHTPLAQVQAWSEVPRGRSLFDSIVVMENYPMSDFLQRQGVGGGISEARFIEQTNYPLTLMVVPTEDLRLKLLYDQTRYEAGTVARLVGHFAECLRGLVRGAGRRVGDVEVLSSTERKQVVSEWNVTTRVYPVTGGLHERFEAQVRSQPEAPAVRYEENTVSYAELNARANRLARRLQAQGVGPEVLVGVYLERSIELVVSLLAILKAGGAYVPLDPSYPMERVQYMLQDAGVQVVVTTQAGAARLGGYSGCWLDVEMSWAEYPSTDLGVAVVPTQAAYVIYTSGSTGRPKGVVNSHVGVTNRLLWMQEVYHLTGEDRVLQKTPFSFDVSVWEFFWPLMTGAQLVVAKPGGHLDPNYLIDIIMREQVTTIHFVPAMLSVFLATPNISYCTSLRQVFSSGEALPTELRDRFFSKLSAEMHNLYGPTEAAIDVTAWDCREPHLGPTVPIGRSIANIQMYVLDKHLRPVPVGVPGEIYIGGIGVSRGYARRPGLTAERFVPDPFGQIPGSRLYKTGDIGRWLTNGAIEYLGRDDFQIKLRGQRIELGEIEQVLCQQKEIKGAVVTINTEQPDNPRLVAYIVPESEYIIDHELLKNRLGRLLPTYMVPAVQVILPTLPLSPNGKVDRKKLPPVSVGQGLLQGKYMPPSNLAERRLVAIWKELLRVEQVGVNDNFFDLGYLILLITLHGTLKEHFGRDIPLIKLFEYPTIKTFAGYLERGDDEVFFKQQSESHVEQRREGRQRLVAMRRRIEQEAVDTVTGAMMDAD